ncbi:Uncharacterized protein TCM_007298 [Theobroma cacao]|uniref:Uncharacterized protein n=1 Tax=Theobroma cacao TaxID=3641 RepID=A0A061E0L0_THECC|nr:Uncharacterized protein TCM_007298 [Theobroma cacao]
MLLLHSKWVFESDQLGSRSDGPQWLAIESGLSSSEGDQPEPLLSKHNKVSESPKAKAFSQLVPMRGSLGLQMWMKWVGWPWCG